MSRWSFAPPSWLKMALSVTKQTVLQFLGNSKSRRISKSHYWFNSDGNFAEWVDFAYRWSFSGRGSAINGTTPSNFFRLSKKISRFCAKSGKFCTVSRLWDCDISKLCCHPVLPVSGRGSDPRRRGLPRGPRRGADRWRRQNVALEPLSDNHYLQAITMFVYDLIC